MTAQQITDNLHEVLNGLTVGWQMANVKDDAQRTHLQAPVLAAQEAVLALLKHFDPEAAHA